MVRTRSYGESDKIVTFLTRDFGKLAAIAKGAKRSRRRFVNALEPFTQLRLGFRQSPASDLAWIESADIVRAARNVTRDLDRYAYSTYVLEVIDCMVEGREAEPAVFDLVAAVLEAIDRGYPTPLSADVLRAFEAQLLRLSGFEPRLEACTGCGRPFLDATAPLRFEPKHGNLRCATCNDGGGIAVSAAAVQAVLLLREGPVCEPPTVPRENATEVRILLQTAIAYHVRRPLRSPELLREILGI